MPSVAWQDRKESVNERVRRAREQLIEEMGGCCEQCGSTDNIQFDHKWKREWVASKLNRHCRIAAYRRDWLAGELGLLCKPCNQKKGPPPHKPDCFCEECRGEWDF